MTKHSTAHGSSTFSFTFHAKMGSIKDRNCMDLTEDIKKILRRGGKNTQKNCTKRIFTTGIITMV